jgi:RHS repeat-associated protein
LKTTTLKVYRTNQQWPVLTRPSLAEFNLPGDTHGFQGMYYDVEIGLYYFRGRYYDPRTGTWLSQDMNGTGLVLIPSLSYNGQTIIASSSLSLQSQNADGLGLYTAFRNNPLTNSDPTGLFSLSELGATTGIQSTLGGLANGMRNCPDRS